jgi:hypothetical protein
VKNLKSQWGKQMTKEALKLALDALDEPHEVQFWNKQEKAIKAIKEALAQPEQKRPQNCGTGYCSCIECVMEPPQRKPLTDEEISNLWSWSMTREAELTATTQQHAFARAIEAKLKEKNNG